MRVDFGSRLRQMREAAGIARRDLATRAQLKENYLEKIECGYSPPPSALAIADLAKGVQADPDELFALSGKLSPDLLKTLLSSPMLVLLVRTGAQWQADELRDFLLARGVAPKKLEWAAIDPAQLKCDERRQSREVVTAEMRRHVFALDGFECVYCSSRSILEVDHIFPASFGGTVEVENLVTCCARCNGKKRNREVAPPRVFGRFRAEIEGGL